MVRTAVTVARTNAGSRSTIGSFGNRLAVWKLLENPCFQVFEFLLAKQFLLDLLLFSRSAFFMASVSSLYLRSSRNSLLAGLDRRFPRWSRVELDRDLEDDLLRRLLREAAFFSKRSPNIAIEPFMEPPCSYAEPPLPL